jgi:hypothetical protein
MSRVPRDSDPRKTTLARASSIYKRQTRPLVREGAPQKQHRNCQRVIWGSTPGLTDWLTSVAVWLWLWEENWGSLLRRQLKMEKCSNTLFKCAGNPIINPKPLYKSLIPPPNKWHYYKKINSAIIPFFSIGGKRDILLTSWVTLATIMTLVVSVVCVLLHKGKKQEIMVGRLDCCWSSPACVFITAVKFLPSLCQAR